MIARWIVGIVTVLFLLAGGWWAVNNLERTTESEWVGLSGDARDNAFLAAERFLERMGVSARHAQSLKELEVLAPRGILVLAARRQTIGAPLRARIVEWINAGGMAIINAEWPRETDPLLDMLGVRRTIGQYTGQQPVEIVLPGFDDALQVRIGSVSNVEVAADAPVLFRSSDSAGSKMLGFSLGAGQVVVLSGFDPFMNASIGDHDHAEFLWRLTRWHLAATPNATPTTLVFDRPSKLSLAKWLQDHAEAVLIALATLVLLWLWRVIVRFGPLAPDPAPTQRRMLDHVAASGRFDWRHGRGHHLVASASAQLLKRLHRAIPESTHVPADRLPALVAARTGVSLDEARRALENAPPIGTRLSAHAFLARIAAIGHLHVALSRRLTTTTSGNDR